MSTYVRHDRVARLRTGTLDRDPMRFERRREAREAASGTWAATYATPELFGIAQFELIDRSASGLGARTRVAIEPGTGVTICPAGSTVPWLSATCVRCDAREDGTFTVGLAFSARRAAA